MDQKNHTPGPWKATRSVPAEGADVFWITAPQGCGPHNGEVDVVNVPGNKLANALLIAAAPELLEALKAMHDHAVDYARINNLFNSDGTPATFHELLQARAAIAKAEGKA